MDISNHQFLNLYHSDFQHTTKQQSITKRTFLLEYINGDIFYPINLWPMKLQSIFWNKPIGDKETFVLFLFFIGNGGSPHVITEWILTSHKPGLITKWRKGQGKVLLFMCFIGGERIT